MKIKLVWAYNNGIDRIIHEDSTERKVMKVDKKTLVQEFLDYVEHLVDDGYEIIAILPSGATTGRFYLKKE